MWNQEGAPPGLLSSAMASSLGSVVELKVGVATAANGETGG